MRRPVSGVEVAEGWLELLKLELAARGEAMPVSRWCGVEIGWSSGMSSSSCRGLVRISWCEWSIPGPLSITEDSFSLGGAGSGVFVADGVAWDVAPRGCAWTDWAGCDGL